MLIRFVFVIAVHLSPAQTAVRPGLDFRLIVYYVTYNY